MAKRNRIEEETSFNTYPSHLKDFNISIPETASKDLDLHSAMGKQSVITRAWQEEYNAVNSLGDDVKFARFQFSSYHNNLIVPSKCFSKMVLQIVKGSGEAAENDLILPVNDVGCSLIKALEVKINDVQIDPGDNLYAYRANLDKQINYPENVKRTGLSSGMFNMEDHSFDVEDIEGDRIVYNQPTNEQIKGKGNDADLSKKMKSVTRGEPRKAFEERFDACRGGKEFTVTSTIHSDIFMQSKVLPPSTKVELQFTTNPEPHFALLKHKEDKKEKFRIKILRWTMLVHYIEVIPEFKANLMDVVQQQGKIMRIPLRQVELTYHVRPKNLKDFSEINSLLKSGSRLPRRIFVALVKQDAFHGAICCDPFHYHDVGAESVTLRVGGQIMPYPELKCTRGNEKPGKPSKNDDISDFLMSFLMTTGTFYSDNTTGITRYNFSKGNFILGWDLTSGDTEQVYEIPSRKNVELSYILNKPDEEFSYVMLVYAEYDAELRIDEGGLVELHKFTPEST